jgi:hypothetical protein
MHLEGADSAHGKAQFERTVYVPLVSGLCCASIVPANAGARRQLSGTSRLSSPIRRLSILGNKGKLHRLDVRQIRCVKVHAQAGTNAEDNDILPAHPPPTSWGPSFETFVVFFLLVFSLLVSTVFFLFGNSFTEASNQLLYSFIAVFSALLSRRGLTRDAQAPRFEEPNPRLPPEWHNLFDRGAERTFYYNSVSKTAQWEAPALLPGPGAAPSSLGTSGVTALYFLRGLFHPFTGVFSFLLTAGVYAGLLMSPCWCLVYPIPLGLPLLFHLLPSTSSARDTCHPGIGPLRPSLPHRRRPVRAVPFAGSAREPASRSPLLPEDARARGPRAPPRP